MFIRFGIGCITAIIISLIVALFMCEKCKREKLKIVENYTRLVELSETPNDFIYYYQLFPERKYLYLSPSAENFFGKGSIEYAYLNPDVAFTDIHPDDFEILCKKVNGELDYSKGIVQRWKNPKGEFICFEEYATPIYENGKMVAIKGILRNIDEKMAMQQELQYRIEHDILTDLYNRNYFEQKNDEFDEQVNTPVAIIICDLDELKYVNDNFGHKEGDLLIKETAAILNKFASEQVTVSRIGGDEFAIIVTDTTKEKTEDLVRNILLKIDEKNEKQIRRKIKLSIGFAFSNNSIGEMTDLFLQADKKMYENKLINKQLLLI